jgi:type VI secretion system secreted protein Hcp
VLVPTVAALGLGIGGAVAAASIPSSNGTITGCYVTPNGVGDSDSPVGSLRVIDPTDSTDSNSQFTGCTQGEATITWNQQGPPGPTGATGPTGPQGVPGQNGANGQNGQNGQNGSAGGVAASSGTGSDVVMELTPKDTNLGGLNPVPQGETQDNSLPNQTSEIFNVTSFDLGADNTVNIGSQAAGAGAGKATFQKFTITKPVDKYSADLFQDLVTQTPLKSAELIVRKPDPSGNGTDIPIAQYLMRTVIITDIHVSGDGRTATETIQGEYAAIQFVFYEQSASGQTKVGSTGGWSQVTNSSNPVSSVGGITSKRHRHR